MIKRILLSLSLLGLIAPLSLDALNKKQRAVAQATGMTIAAASMATLTGISFLYAFMPHNNPLFTAPVITERPEKVCSKVITSSYDIHGWSSRLSKIDETVICTPTGRWERIRHPYLEHAINNGILPIILSIWTIPLIQIALEQWQQVNDLYETENE